MKIIICLLFVGLICRTTADPVCTFAFDNDKYLCPLSGGNIDASYEGSIGGTHYSSKFEHDNDHPQNF